MGRLDEGYISEKGYTRRRYFRSRGHKFSSTYGRSPLGEDLVIFFHIRPNVGTDQPSEWLVPISSDWDNRLEGETAPVALRDGGEL